MILTIIIAVLISALVNITITMYLITKTSDEMLQITKAHGDEMVTITIQSVKDFLATRR